MIPSIETTLPLLLTDREVSVPPLDVCSYSRFFTFVTNPFSFKIKTLIFHSSFLSLFLFLSTDYNHLNTIEVSLCFSHTQLNICRTGTLFYLLPYSPLHKRVPSFLVAQKLRSFVSFLMNTFIFWERGIFWQIYKHSLVLDYFTVFHVSNSWF